MSKVSKGNRVESLAKKYLESLGYLVDKKPRTHFQSPDFFGMFDLLAIKTDQVEFIQVKSNASNVSTAKKGIKKFAIENKLDLNFYIWLYEGRGNWRKWELVAYEWLETFRGKLSIKKVK